MDKHIELTQQEKEAVFDQVWTAYTTPKKFQLWQPIVTIAAIFIVSLTLLLLPGKTAVEESASIYTSMNEEVTALFSVDEEQESIYEAELSGEDLNTILAEL